jgi:hypothetical protein
MTTLLNLKWLLSVVLMFIASHGLAAPGAVKTCQKMISDNRADGQTQAQCECNYALAEKIFDDEVTDLLFDSWYNGTNNMAKLEALPNQNRIFNQMKKMKRQSDKKCQ